jgi:hypothetical protein
VQYPVGLVGDAGACVYAGQGKRIVWVVKKDVDRLGKDLKINIVATPVEKCDPKPMTPVIAGFAGVGLASVGLVFVGLKNKKTSNLSYNDYKHYVNPNDVFYLDKARTDLYSEANKKYKSYQYFTYGGIGLATLGGAFFVRKFLKTKRHNKKCAEKNMGFLSNPNLEMQPLVFTSVGMSITYKF